ncbi:MAG TPA: hypothetical protein EYN66_06380, partial [Myxococcales bacterium]|nr:hypothetical protein [Myxococcales bacterium]
MMREAESHGLNSKDYNLAGLTAAELTTETAAEERDLRLVAAMIRYVADFRFLTKAHPLESDKDPKQVFKARAKEIGELAVSLFPKPAHGLKALWPAHPDYAAIR